MSNEPMATPLERMRMRLEHARTAAVQHYTEQHRAIVREMQDTIAAAEEAYWRESEAYLAEQSAAYLERRAA